MILFLFDVAPGDEAFVIGRTNVAGKGVSDDGEDEEDEDEEEEEEEEDEKEDVLVCSSWSESSGSGASFVGVAGVGPAE